MKNFVVYAVGAILCACVAPLLLEGCKSRVSSRLESNQAEPDGQWIVWVVDWKKNTEIIDIGRLQPDGGISYDQAGMQKLAWLVEDMLLTNTIVDENLIRAIERRASLGSKNDSSQIARNSLPQELIPAPLWNKGIRWDYFIWPLDELKPDNLEKSYKLLRPEDRPKMTPHNQLLASDEITFQRLMMYYRTVYDLPVFQRIRVNVQKDRLYTSAAKSFLAATNLAVSTATSLVYFPVNGMWKFLIPASGKLASASRVLLTMFTVVIPPEYVAGQIHNATYRDKKWADDLQDLRALRQDGAIKGPEYLAANRAAIEWFRSGDGARLAPRFAQFVTDPRISWFLLDPVNCYDLSTLVDEVKGMDQQRLRTLNSTTKAKAVGDLAAQLADGLGPAGRQVVEQCTSARRMKELDEAASNEIAEYIKIGSRSPLFNEMIMMMLARKPDRKIELMSDPRYITGVTSLTKPVRLVSGVAKWELSTRMAMTYTLAHESWHAVSKHWIFNQLFNFSGQGEFALAVAGDETVASLLSLAIRDEIKADRSNFLENAQDIVDSMNYMGYFKYLSGFNPQDLQNGPMLDAAMAMQSDAFNQWRGETIPKVSLPIKKTTPWYVSSFAHLSTWWVEKFPRKEYDPCAEFQ